MSDLLNILKTMGNLKDTKLTTNSDGSVTISAIEPKSVVIRDDTVTAGGQGVHPKTESLYKEVAYKLSYAKVRHYLSLNALSISERLDSFINGTFTYVEDDNVVSIQKDVAHSVTIKLPNNSSMYLTGSFNIGSIMTSVVDNRNDYEHASTNSVWLVKALEALFDTQDDDSTGVRGDCLQVTEWLKKEVMTGLKDVKTFDNLLFTCSDLLGRLDKLNTMSEKIVIEDTHICVKKITGLGDDRVMIVYVDNIGVMVNPESTILASLADQIAFTSDPQEIVSAGIKIATFLNHNQIPTKRPLIKIDEVVIHDK